MELNNTFKLTNEQGEEITYVGLSVVENPEDGTRYLIYTEVENAKAVSGRQVNLYACVYSKENGRIILDPIETEKEKTLIKTFIEKNIHVA
ncbi:MAG: hypothetical protein NC300_12695 [Bacteroidales bacterium]|nr:hypothetical protein [Clostridium sp.]MCM1204993.1 hypothetical protein [Bacteroidales bacterium]